MTLRQAHKIKIKIVFLWLSVCCFSPAELIVDAQESKLKGMSQSEKSIDGVLVFTGTIPDRTWAGEKCPLSLAIKNIGKKKIEIDDDVSRTFQIHLEYTSGHAVPKTLFGQEYESRAKGIGLRYVFITLESGKAGNVKLDLARLFDLTAGGTITAKIECTYDLLMGEARKTHVVRIENLKFIIDSGSLPNFTLESP
jgi:hypothetical protein